MERRGMFMAVALAGLLSGDQKHPNTKEMHSETPTFPKDSSTEQRQTTAESICKIRGEGHHIAFDQDHNEYQVGCHHTGAIRVAWIDETNSESPKPHIETMHGPEELNHDGLLKYTDNKSVVLFGENHGKEADAKRLIEVLPDLKNKGFTTLAIEIDNYYQFIIDAFLNSEENNTTPTLATLQKSLGELKAEPDLLYLIAAAKKNGLEIKCVDNVLAYEKIQDSFPDRDKFMLEKIQAQLNDGKKVLVFIGTAHARLTKETSFMYQYDQPLHLNDGITGGTVHKIKPLAWRLEEAIGTEKLGSVNLTDQEELDIPVKYRGDQ